MSYDNLKAAYSPIIIGVTILACVYYWVSLLDTQKAEMDMARHQGELHVIQLNDAIAQQMDATLRSVDTALLHLRDVYIHDRRHFNRSAQDVLASYPKGMLQYITVFDAKGYLVYSSTPAKDHIYFGDREHFRVHADSKSDEDELFISKPIIGRIAGVSIVQFTRAIRDRKRFLGVIGIPLRPDYLSNNLGALSIDPTDLIAIVRLDGSIISRSRNLEAGLRTTVPADRPFLHALSGGHGIYRSKSAVDKVPMLFAWKRLASWPVISITAIDEISELEAVSSKQTDEKIRTVLAIAMVVFFAFGVSILILRINRKNDDLIHSKQELQGESEKNLALLRNASDGIHILDTEGNIIEVSDSFCSMLGYRREEMIGMNVSEWDAGFVKGEELALQSEGNSKLRLVPSLRPGTVARTGRSSMSRSADSR